MSADSREIPSRHLEQPTAHCILTCNARYAQAQLRLSTSTAAARDGFRGHFKMLKAC